MSSEWGNRTLAYFFGNEPAMRFLDALTEVGIPWAVPGEDIDIYLPRFAERLPELAEGLVRALNMLLNSERVSTNLHKRKVEKFSKRHEYTGGPFAEVHRALFRFADEHYNVWLQGLGNYGVRVAYKGQSNGISMIRSYGDDRLGIIGRR